MTRKDSEESILEISVKDICRSEKHYLNVAYDENCDVSDDEGQHFMVQVDLGQPRNKKSATVSYHIMIKQTNREGCTEIISPESC